MLKIALLFLFCAISGYGINGLPDSTSVTTKPELNKAISTDGIINHSDTNSNGKTTPPQVPPSSSPVTIPERIVTESQNNIIIPITSNTEKNDSITAKIPTVENTSTNIPSNKVFPMTAASPKTAIDNLNIPVTSTVSPPITESPAATRSPSISVTNTSPNNPPTTTISPITTSEAPVVPVPTPKPGKWVVNETNQTCIVINMAVQFNVSYVNKENKTIVELFNLPDSNNDTVVTGECGKLEQYIRLSFNDTKNVTNQFTLHFVKNESISQYSLHNLEVKLLNPNDTEVFEHNGTLFSAGLKNSYRCLKKQNFDLTHSGTNTTMGHIFISELQFQAFKTDNNKDFGEVKDCKLDTPDIVPIAVGCALAGLVITVLIAYLMARRRNQGRGYLSM